MLYRAYSVSFACMEICIGSIGFVCERKLKKQSQKKLISRPPFKFLVAKPKKIAKNNSGGVSFAKMLVSQILKVWTVQLRPGQTGIYGPAEASGQNHQHQAHRHQQGAPLSQDLPPQGEGGVRVRRTHYPSHSPSPAPSSTPSLQQHAPPPPNAPQGRKNREGPEEAGMWKGMNKGR